MTFPTKFKAKIVPGNPSFTRTKPCRVVKVANGRVLSRHDSRVDCAKVLGIHQAYVSLLIHGTTSSKLVDDKHGELHILDGAYAIKPKKPRKPKAPAKPRKPKVEPDGRAAVSNMFGIKLSDLLQPPSREWPMPTGRQ
jgi:hypothetical protein